MDRAPAWVVPAMRVGYVARGIVYILIGILAVRAAWRGGPSEGAKGALSSLTDNSWGTAMLWVIAVGFFCYAVWRFIAAWMDLERHGTGAKGIVARTGLIVTGVIHAGLGIYAVKLAMTGSGGGSADGSGSEERWTAWLMSQPFGPWLVVAVGLIVIGAGLYYGYKGYTEKYKEHLRYSPTVERLEPICKAGLIAQGIVVGIIGAFLVWAGWTSDPSEAGGLADAFETVRTAAFGRILLGALAVGMLAFGIENFVEAWFRIVPARAGTDVTTLASRARYRAKRGASAVGIE